MFTKMHGLGNDFMVFDRVTQDIEFSPADVARWADRRTGIGFDQLLTVEPPVTPDADFRYRIYNADGTEAEQCGNGARCVAKLVSVLNLSPKPTLIFETSNGRIETRLLDQNTVEVDMGVPRLEPDAVPFEPSRACRQELPGYLLQLVGGDPPQPVGTDRSQPVDSQRPHPVGTDRPQPVGSDLLQTATHKVIPVSMGNPHGVIFVGDVTTLPVAKLGVGLTAHPFFPEKANIGFCQIIDSGFVRLRVFERGVGETRACGTGACAAVVAGRLTGELNERVKVSLPGGKVRIRWPGEGSSVKMTGPATLVFHGKLTI